MMSKRETKEVFEKQLKKADGKKCKEFVLYFKALDKAGVPYGGYELRLKARELSLPIPHYMYM